MPIIEAMHELRWRGARSRRTLEMDIRSAPLGTGVIKDQAAVHPLVECIRDRGLAFVDVTASRIL